MNSTRTRTAVNYTFRYTQGDGTYVAKAVEIDLDAYAVTMHAPNGDEATFAALQEAEQWMLRHFHGEVTGHHLLCGCFL